MIKRLFKKLIFAVAPQTATAIQSARSRYHSHKLVKQWGLFNINDKLLTSLGNRVLSGPFQGLILTPMTYQEHIGPFLLGTYEAELHPWFEIIRNCKFDQIIDIGSKFGYYAVGLARLFPETDVIAYDTDWWARKATHEMAEANRVHRISIRGYCSPQTLTNDLRENTFIISDCEGYEGELFCNTLAPALATAVLIIELHESFCPEVTSRIQKRFAPTHHIAHVASRSAPILPTHVARPSALSEEEFLRASSEVRSQQEWIFVTPKTNSSLCPEFATSLCIADSEPAHIFSETSGTNRR